MSSSIPQSTKSLVLRLNPSKSPIYHDIELVETPLASLQPDELLVKISAAAFNHRDLWIRKGLYPGLLDGSVLGSDGAGSVVASGRHQSPEGDPMLGTKVFLTPMRGWKEDPETPEDILMLLGGGLIQGTFSHYVIVEREQVIPIPSHLDYIHAAAWPLAGVTAWRAAIVNGHVARDSNVLITGIGGGVALTALQLCVAHGANVFVTSSSQAKIQNAIALGAKGGALYTDKSWPSHISSLVQNHGTKTQLLDSIIDSGGGDVMNAVGRYLKQGGRLVCYGMTATPKITMTMKQVLANQRLIGSTMGSKKDLEAATAFLDKHKIVPVVSTVLHGLEESEKGFEQMSKGEQSGKIVISLDAPLQGKF